jgi:hypothetical protein
MGGRWPAVGAWDVASWAVPAGPAVAAAVAEDAQRLAQGRAAAQGYLWSVVLHSKNLRALLL